MITLFEMCLEESKQVEEEAFKVEKTIQPPTLGQVLKMGGNRDFRVVEVEEYQGTETRAYVAWVHPVDREVPPPQAWTRHMWVEIYPQRSFDVEVSPNMDIITYGWNMNGFPTTGRLYAGNPTDHPTQLNRVPLPWVVDLVTTHNHYGVSTYSGIHVCHCLPSPIPETVAA